MFADCERGVSRSFVETRARRQIQLTYSIISLFFEMLNRNEALGWRLNLLVG